MTASDQKMGTSVADTRGMADGNRGSGGSEKGAGEKDQNPSKKPRGFAAMDQEKQRAISRKGGESVPDEKRSFSQNRELAAEAGRKGGTARGRGAGGNSPEGEGGSEDQ
jgi:uncharacterized protein